MAITKLITQVCIARLAWAADNLNRGYYSVARQRRLHTAVERRLVRAARPDDQRRDDGRAILLLFVSTNRATWDLDVGSLGTLSRRTTGSSAIPSTMTSPPSAPHT
ncbi:MAG: hypothetical protein MZV64_24050 [Ignavibacteriales bacterium]|nr:hypothetical protein [Ignavibacteriales bacterium]